MCIRQHSQPRSATRPASSGAARNAVTSLTYVAPASSAARATATFDVSMLNWAASPSASMTGTTRRSSSSSGTGSARGRVDSPPTSISAAPCAASSRPCATASSNENHSPPSENESGVTFRTPMMRSGRVTAGASLRELGLFRQVEPARLGAGEAGPRQRARGLAARALGGRRRRRRLDVLGRLGAENVLLGTALEQGLELVGLDRLALDEDLADRPEVLAVLREDVLGALVGGLDDPADLVVDLARDLVGVVGLGRELAAQERLAVVVAEHARAEALAHAEAHDHLLRGGRDLLEVVRGAGRDLAEDDLLGGAAAERHRHRVGQLRARGEELVLRRQRDRVAERLPAADDRDLVDRVAVRQEMADDRVPELVVGRDQPLLLRHHAGFLLRARDHPHDPLLELLHGDLAAACAGGEQRRLVDQVGEVGAGEAGGLAGESVEVDRLRERLPASVDLEDLLAPLAVGPVDDDLAVEAAGPQQRRVEDVRPVGGGDQDDVVFHLEAVHLDEELVQRLLALVVAAAHAGAAVTADGVDLVHEDDAGRVLLRLLEEVAHAAGADADEHLDEVRAGDREEGHAGLTRDGAGEQRLAGPRRRPGR